MRNALKAVGAILAVIALCAPLMFLPDEDTQPAALGHARVTVTVPPTVVVATTIPGLETTTTTQPPAPPPSTVAAASTTTTTLPADISIAAAGGLFVTPEILASVHDADSDSYDFGPVFAPIAPYLSAADYAIADLQPRLAGPEVEYGSKSAPNAPRELAFALRSAGFDLVGTANPNSLTLGWEGVTGTLDRLDAAGLKHVGTARTSAERNTPVIVEIDGIKVAFLDYTASLAVELPEEERKGYAVNVLDLATVTLDANTARSWGADAVVAMVNFGEDEQEQPDADQKTLSEEILSRGVDVIVGSRAGSIQTIGHFFPFLRANDKYVAYSLGGFLSTPIVAPDEGPPWFGMLVYIHFQKRGLRTYTTGVSYLPLYVQTGAPAGEASAGEEAAPRDEVPTFRILPVLPGLEPDTDIPLTTEDRDRMREIWEYARSVLYRPDESIVPYSLGVPTR